MIKRHSRSSTFAALAVVAATALSACGSESQSGEPINTTSNTVVTTAPPVTETTMPVPSGPDHDDAGSNSTSPDRVVDAADGVVARERAGQLGVLGEASASASTSAIGDCGIPFEPSEQDLTIGNADAQGLVDSFERFGVEHTAVTDSAGWLMVDYDSLDAVAQSVADSYWTARYSAEYNDDSESVEGDDAPLVLDVEEELVVELSGPTGDDIARQDTENARLSDAFDAAGIEYELVADELGWEWIEWDFDDPELFNAVDTVFRDLYPPTDILPVESCIVIDTFGGDEGIGDGQPLPAESDRGEPIEVDKPVDEFPIPDFEDGAPVQDPVEVLLDEARAADRDADIDALADGFLEAGVPFDVEGESPWRTVIFDIADDASVPVVAAIIAAR